MTTDSPIRTVEKQHRRLHRKQAVVIAVASLLASTGFSSAAADQASVEIAASHFSPTHYSSALPKLRDRQDPALQQSLESAFHGMNLSQAARRGQIGAALVDITHANQPKVATINADHMVYAASLPKIGILLGAFHAINQGELTYDDATQNSLTRMIRNSSNRAASEMLQRVGKRNLANLLQSDQYRLYDREHNGGLWVGREYAKGNPAIRDPLHNISHGASPMQVARFYYLLENGRLVSESHSREMKKILGNPAINHKFVQALNKHRPGSKIFRKSGTWRTYHSDSAIVERDGRRYIAVVLADSAQGSQWLGKLIVAMDDIVFSTPATGAAEVAALQ